MAGQGPDDLLWVDSFLSEYLETEVGSRSRYAQAERLEQQGRPGQAAEVLRKEADRAPGSRPFVALGILLAKAGRLPEAEHALRAAIEHDSEKVQAHYFLAVVQYMQAEKRREAGAGDEANAGYRQAIQSAETALKLKSDHGLAQLYLGLARQRLGELPAAITALRAAVDCRPEMAETHLRLAQALLEQGEKEEALTELELAVRLSPTNTEAQTALDATRRAP